MGEIEVIADPALTTDAYIRQRQLLTQLFREASNERGVTITSISPGILGIQPQEGIVVTARAEQSLYTALQNHTILPLRIFEKPCQELCTLHSLSYFLGDIKTDNFMLLEISATQEGLLNRASETQLKYAEIRNLCCTREIRGRATSFYGGIPFNRCGTIGYSTMNQLYLDQILFWDRSDYLLKAKDEYAFLITLLESVSVEFRNIFINQLNKLETHERELHEEWRLKRKFPSDLQTLDKGILSQLLSSPRYRAVVDTLITKLIEPQYRKDISNFLTDPF